MLTNPTDGIEALARSLDPGNCDKSKVADLSRKLYASPEARRMALQLDVIAKLVHIIGSTQTYMHAVAARALTNLLILQAAREFIEIDDIVSLTRLLTGLLNSADPEVLIAAASALRNLCWKSNRATAAAFENGAFPLLVKCLSHRDTAAQASAAEALAQLCSNYPAAEITQDHGCVPAATQLLRSKCPRNQRGAAELLSKLLVASPAARADDALISQTIPALLGLIEVSETEDMVVAEAIGALANANIVGEAHDPSLAAVPALIRRLGSANDDIVVATCAALQNIGWTKRIPSQHTNVIRQLKTLRDHSPSRSLRVKHAAESAIKSLASMHTVYGPLRFLLSRPSQTSAKLLE